LKGSRILPPRREASSFRGVTPGSARTKEEVMARRRPRSWFVPWIVCVVLLAPRLATGQATQLFAGPISYDVGDIPLDVASGDLNADGRPDLVVANAASNSISLLYSNDLGTLDPAVNKVVGTVPPIIGAPGPCGLAIADVSGDGIVDIAVANYLEATVSVLLGKTGGGFKPLVAYPGPGSTGVVTFSDLTGDGLPDLLVVGGNLMVYPALGAGAFGVATTYGSVHAADLGVGDLDEDGDMDVAVTVSAASFSGVSVLFGLGGGALSAPTQIASLTQYSRAFAVADLDSDGHLDIIALDYGGSVVVLLGHGDGSFADAITYVSGVVGIDHGDLLVEDLNADSRLDVVVVDSESNELSVLVGLGNGQLSKPLTCAAGPSPAAVCAIDLDGDSQPELATVNASEGTLSVFARNARGMFSAATASPVGLDPRSIIAADFDGDGHLDLATADTGWFADNGSVSILLGNGTGAFALKGTYPTQSYTEDLASGDFDHDGTMDVVAVNRLSGTVSVLLGSGDGALGSPVSYAVGLQPMAVAVGRIDENDWLDIVVANSGSTTVSVLLGRPGGEFGIARDYSVGQGVEAVALGDLDGDGRLDLVAAKTSGNTASVLFNQGAGAFGSKQTIMVGASPSAVALADLNADAVLDLVVARQGLNSVAVMLGQGDGTFGVLKAFAVGDHPRDVCVGDVDGDGHLDVAVCNAYAATVSVLLGDGSGDFATSPEFAFAEGCYRGALADLNGDGSLDMAVASWFYGYASVLFNKAE